MGTDFESIVGSCEKMAWLMRDPEPGLVTWHGAVKDRAKILLGQLGPFLESPRVSGSDSHAVMAVEVSRLRELVREAAESFRRMNAPLTAERFEKLL